jgi:hypothetical protein
MGFSPVTLREEEGSSLLNRFTELSLDTREPTPDFRLSK